MFMWCIMRTKVPIWDTTQKGFNIGHVWCYLCRSNEENIEHLFMECAYIVHVWNICKTSLGNACSWASTNLEECWRHWFQNPNTISYKALPLIISSGILLACNKCIFQDALPHSEKVFVEGLSILSFFPQPQIEKHPR